MLMALNLMIREYVNTGIKNEEVAKNLLLGRMCDSCTHCGNIGFRLNASCILEGYEQEVPIPKENTCLKWEEGFPLELKMSSIPVQVKARKLNIRWTKDEG